MVAQMMWAAVDTQGFWELTQGPGWLFGVWVPGPTGDQGRRIQKEGRKKQGERGEKEDYFLKAQVTVNKITG